MLTQRKRPGNAELLELVRLQDELDALREVLDAARSETQDAERAAKKAQTAKFEDWMRAMRESGRAHEIHKGKPVKPRSAERVETEQAVTQAQALEADARRRFVEREDETWKYLNTFRQLTAEDQRRLILLRGWPTERYTKAVRSDPKMRPQRPRSRSAHSTVRPAMCSRSARVAAAPHRHVFPPARQVCLDSGASMPFRRTCSGPTFSVSPSMTAAAPDT